MPTAPLISEQNDVIRVPRIRKVPDYLVKEEIDGIKFYYKGYEQVLNKSKQKEEIMGCSGLQSIIVEYLFKILIRANADKIHRILTNEAGNNLALRTNLQFDIAIYKKIVLTSDKITRRYVRGIAPEVVIEIDLDVEIKGTGLTSDIEFVQVKTQKLLDYGTKKVIWIFTKGRKVLIAEGKNWRFESWDNEIEILDGILFNLEKYLAEEGIDPDAV
jgi:hypothetical protein